MNFFKKQMNLKKENVYIKVEKISIMIFYKIFYYYFNEIYIKFFFNNFYN